MAPKRPKRPARTYTISLANRKPRGSGHERLGEILIAAKKLFAERGVENVTTREIAARVGISQTALFTYYKNRDEIFDRLMEGAFRELALTLDAVTREATDTRDWLKRLIAGYIEFGLKHPDEYRLAFMVIKTHRRSEDLTRDRPGAVQRVGFPVFEKLERGIAEAMDKRVLRADIGPPALVAQVMWAAIHGLTALLIARPRPHFPWASRDELIAAQAELLLDGLLQRNAEE
jgi:AcrR family transcriptional regulator